jgi:hypothetical protein
MKYELHPICAPEVTPADLVADIKAFFTAARSGAKEEEGGPAAWRDNTMKLAKALLVDHELHQNDNNAFGAWLSAHGLIAIADASGKHPRVRWTTSDGRELALTLPKKPYSSANAQSLAKLRRALEGASQ